MRYLFLALLLLLSLPVRAALDAARVAAIAEMLPAAAGGSGPVCADRTAWSQPAVAARLTEVVADAEKRLKRDFPPWDDAAYLDYSKTGQRPKGERMMNARKAFLYPLVLAECVEYRGRFLPAIERTLSELVAQPTWTWAPHDRNLRNFRERNYDVDLFSADTAHDLAQALYMLGERLNPELRRNTLDALETRVFAPLRRSFAGMNKDNGWLKADHNWNAVCLKGAVAAAQAALPDRHDRALFVAAGEHYIRSYLAGFPADGYSVEGPSYWNYGFSHFVELREVLMQASGGRIDLFTEPKVRTIALYGARIEMAPGNIAAFSDASPRERIDVFTLAYSNQTLGLGLPLTPDALPISASRPPNSAPLALAAMILFAHPQARAGDAVVLDPLRSYFEQVGILVTRPAPGSGSTLAASIKAGGNGNHSHNDVGSWSVALGAEQPVGDVGRPPYTSKTFSKERYTIRAFNSYGHPVPVVAGELQQEARTIRPVVLATRFSPDADEISIDLAPAYAVKPLTSLTRTLRHERAGGGRVSVEDRFGFSSAEHFETALTTLGDWQRLPDGPLLLWQKKERLHARIAASAPFEVASEKIDEDGFAFTRIAIRLLDRQRSGWIRVEMQGE